MKPSIVNPPNSTSLLGAKWNPTSLVYRELTDGNVDALTYFFSVIREVGEDQKPHPLSKLADTS